MDGARARCRRSRRPASSAPPCTRCCARATSTPRTLRDAPGAAAAWPCTAARASRRRSKTSSSTSSSTAGGRVMRRRLPSRARSCGRSRRDRRTLLILLFVPAMFLLLYGYALNFDIRNIALAVEDRDRSAAEPRAGLGLRQLRLLRSRGRRHLGRGDRAADRSQRGPRGAGHSRRATAVTSSNGRRSERAGDRRRRQREHRDDGDRLRAGHRRRGRGWRTSAPSRVAAADQPSSRASGTTRSCAARCSWCPGLIAYISMITAVISTALSIVREKERGTMEQVRMAPVSPAAFVLGKTMPYLVLSFVSALLIILVAMALFDLPMRGSWLLLCGGDRAVPDRRAGAGPGDLERGADAAGGVSAGAAVVVSADVHPLRASSSRSRACRGPIQVDHPRRAGALLPRRAARHRAEGRRASRRSGRTWWRWRSSRP